MNASASVADLSRLNFLLGELYADAVAATQRKFGLECELVGCHGQTIYHQGETAAFLGRKIACTWQIGEGAVVAARLGVPVVSDFRPADMAAGGKGAPLVISTTFCFVTLAADVSCRTSEACQPHGNSSGSLTSRCNRLRYRPRKHGYRCGREGVVRRGVRSRRQARS